MKGVQLCFYFYLEEGGWGAVEACNYVEKSNLKIHTELTLMNNQNIRLWDYKLKKQPNHSFLT